MENNPDFENYADLNNLFLKLIKDDIEKDLLKLIMQNKSDEAVYKQILEGLRKKEVNND